MSEDIPQYGEPVRAPPFETVPRQELVDLISAMAYIVASMFSTSVPLPPATARLIERVNLLGIPMMSDTDPRRFIATNHHNYIDCPRCLGYHELGNCRWPQHED